MPEFAQIYEPLKNYNAKGPKKDIYIKLPAQGHEQDGQPPAEWLSDKLAGVVLEFSAAFPLHKKRQKLHLFNPILDEEELADCFYRLYVKNAKSMRKYGQKECDKLRFSAFLYYLVKDTVLQSDKFNQTTFYQFIQNKVFNDLKQNVRTFNNRVTALEILDIAMKHPTDYAKNPDFSDFRHLKEKFQETDFFKGLMRLRNGLSRFL